MTDFPPFIARVPLCNMQEVSFPRIHTLLLHDISTFLKRGKICFPPTLHATYVLESNFTTSAHHIVIMKCTILMIIFLKSSFLSCKNCILCSMGDMIIC